MGLDIVELVMDVEDRFDITITDEDGNQLRTVGDLVMLVRRKLQFREDRCLTSHVFYRLRRAFETCGIAREPGGRLRPAIAISHVFPLQTRRSDWTILQAKIGMSLPELVRSRRLVASIWWCAWSIGMIAALFTSQLDLHYRVAECIAVAAVSGSLLLLATRPWKRHLSSVQTIGDLARSIMARNFGAIVGKVVSAREREVREAVYAIIAESLGVRAEELRDDLRFVQDLNVG